MGFNIIIDTREKQPYSFAKNKWCDEQIVRKLDTGDYTAEGLEDILCIERKKTVSEIAQNLTTKRFQNELERMMEYPYRYILCEFDWSDVLTFPYNGELPSSIARKIRVRATSWCPNYWSCQTSMMFTYYTVGTKNRGKPVYGHYKERVGSGE